MKRISKRGGERHQLLAALKISVVSGEIGCLPVARQSVWGKDSLQPSLDGGLDCGRRFARRVSGRFGGPGGRTVRLGSLRAHVS